MPFLRAGEAASEFTNVASVDQLARGGVTAWRHGPVIAGCGAAPYPPPRVLRPSRSSSASWLCPLRRAVTACPSRQRAAGHQAAGEGGPGGGCQRPERGRRCGLTGQVPRPRRTVSAGLTHLRHRPWADRTPPEIMPGRGSPCSPPGRAERENGHVTNRNAQPGARVTRAHSAGPLAIHGNGVRASASPAPAQAGPPRGRNAARYGKPGIEPASQDDPAA
jgi:hypothetical protein